MKKFSFILVIFGISGCASFPGYSVPSKPPQKDISLFDIEHLQAGKTISKMVRTEFGEPDQIVSFSEDMEIWSYVRISHEEPLQRANLVFSKKSGTLLTSTWLPRETDPLHDRSTTLAYFKDAQFALKDLGWVAQHEYSDKATYTDAHLGVSFEIRKSMQTVSAISFAQPEPMPLAQH